MALLTLLVSISAFINEVELSIDGRWNTVQPAQCDLSGRRTSGSRVEAVGKPAGRVRRQGMNTVRTNGSMCEKYSNASLSTTKSVADLRRAWLTAIRNRPPA